MFDVILYKTNGVLHTYNNCAVFLNYEDTISIVQDLETGGCRGISFKPADVLKIEILENNAK